MEAAERGVNLEIEIVRDKPAAALIRASESATMICVGAVSGDGAAEDRDRHVRLRYDRFEDFYPSALWDRTFSRFARRVVAVVAGLTSVGLTGHQ